MSEDVELLPPRDAGRRTRSFCMKVSYDFLGELGDVAARVGLHKSELARAATNMLVALYRMWASELGEEAARKRLLELVRRYDSEP